MKRTKFYVCPHCGAIMQGTGECSIVCCGKQLEPQSAKPADDSHLVKVSEIENDFYITFEHEMTKEHFIHFVSYVSFDRVLTVKLYPEQDPSVRFPRMHSGKLCFFCTEHGLFEYTVPKKPRTRQ